jgi:hypothetical protein
MTLRFSRAAFSVGFCIAYLVVFACNWPLFFYDPVLRTFSHAASTDPNAGPAIAWYGLVSSAALLATLFAVVVSDEWLLRVLRRALWLFPVISLAGAVLLLRKFFL